MQVLRRRTSTTPHAFGRYSHLWASSEIESARSRPANADASRARPPPAGRRRRRRAATPALRAQTSASSAIGSIAPVSVVPAVATTATGVTPAAGRCRSRRRRRPAAAGGGRRGRARAPGRPPIPSSSTARVDRVVRLLRAVDGARWSRPCRWRGAGQRPLARGRQRGQVADGAAAGEGAAAGGEADQLPHPAHRLVLDLAGGAGVDRHVGVEAGRQRVADDADLEPRGADEREVARPRLGDRLVEDPRSVVQHRRDSAGPSGSGACSIAPHAVVDRRLVGTGLVEAPPRLDDQRRRPLEHLLSGRLQMERRGLLHS